MRQCQRLTIWSGCPAHAKTKTGCGDPRLTSFVRGPVLANSVFTGIQVLPKCYLDPPLPNFLAGTHGCPPKIGDPRLTQRGPRVDLRPCAVPATSATKSGPTQLRGPAARADCALRRRRPATEATLGWFGDRSGARSMLRLPEPALLGVL